MQSKEYAIFVTLNGGRGSKEVVSRQMSAFADNGYTVSLISTQPFESVAGHTVKIDIGDRPVPIHDYLPCEGPTVSIHSLKPPAADEYKRLFVSGINQALDEIHADPRKSIMVVHHANIHTVAAHEVSREKGIPYFVQPHGTCIGGFQKSGKVDAYHKGKKEGRTWGEIEFALNDAQAVIAISDFVKKKQIAPYMQEKKKIHTVYNEIDFKALDDVDEEFVPQLKKDKRIQNLPFILQIGVLTKWKRPLELAEATHFLPDNVQTIFIGHDEKGMGSKVEKEGKNTTYLGPQYGAKRNALLSSASVLAVSSLKEPFGLTPLEANALGIPAVARPKGAMPEIVIDGINGYIAEDESVCAYARALHRGLTASPLLRGETLVAYVRSKYGPENTSARIVELAQKTMHPEGKKERRNTGIPLPVQTITNQS